MNALIQLQTALLNFRNLEIASPWACESGLFVLARNQLERGIEILKQEYEDLNGDETEEAILYPTDTD